MATVRKGVLAIQRAPDLHGMIVAGGGDALAIGGPGHGSYRPSMMTTINVDQALLHYVPDMHLTIAAPKGQGVSIRRPGQR